MQNVLSRYRDALVRNAIPDEVGKNPTFERDGSLNCERSVKNWHFQKNVILIL